MAANHSVLAGSLIAKATAALPQLVVLRARQNRIKGEIPESLRSCTPLLQLLLSINALTGPLGFLDWPQMRELKVFYNYVSGPIPESLSSCSFLQMFDACSNKMKGSLPPSLFSSKSLAGVDVSNNARFIGSIPEMVNNLPQLETFLISGSVLKGGVIKGSIPDGLASCTNLKELRINDNLFTDALPNMFGHLTRLWIFDATGNEMRGTMPDDIGSSTALLRFLASNNYFSGSIPASINSLVFLTALRLDDNMLSGPLPEQLGQLHRLEDLDVSMNHLSGPLPQQIGRLRRLRKLLATENSLVGSMPESLGSCTALESLCIEQSNLVGLFDPVVSLTHLQVLRLCHNKLSGSLPELLGNMHLLRDAALFNNSISGSIPRSIGSCMALQFLMLSCANLEGSIPDNVRSCKALQWLHVEQNKVVGSFPEAFGSLRLLVDFKASRNEIRSSIPETVGAWMNMRNLEIYQNKLSGTFPAVFGDMTELDWLQAFENKLAGTFPDGLGCISTLRTLDLGQNALTGKIPATVGSVHRLALQDLYLNDNELKGTLPAGLASFSQLTGLNLNENHFSGVLPPVLAMLRNLKFLFCGRNLFAGAVPTSFSELSDLKMLAISSDNDRRRLHGVLPPRLSKLRDLSTLVANGHSFRGGIPALLATFQLLAIHQNELRSMSALHLVDTVAVVLLHRNRLSCRLPRGEKSRARTSLVGVGNHISWPDKGKFPAWVSPAEREGLFWYEAATSFQLMMKALTGSVVLVCVVWLVIGGKDYLHMIKTLHALIGVRYPLAKQIKSLLSSLVRHLLRTCLLLPMLFACNYYVCPGALYQASSCLDTRVFVQIMVVVVWSCLCLEELQMPWWTRGAVWRKMRRGPGASLLRIVLWVCWLVLVILMSGFVVVDMGAKSVPSFLWLSGALVRVMSASIGLIQGAVSGFLIPLLAHKLHDKDLKLRSLRSAALTSAASMLSTYLIPSLVVLYLDEMCADRWTRWFKECSGTHLDIVQPLVYADIRVMRRDDVCAPRPHVSVAACARSLALKLQEVFLGKLVVTAFLMPVARIFSGRHYGRTDEVVIRLSLLLELGMLFGAALPLTAPLLCFGVLSEELLAALASHDGLLKAVSESGDVKFAILTTYMGSVLFHGCFVCEDLLALPCLVCLAMKTLCLVWRSQSSTSPRAALTTRCGST